MRAGHPLAEGELTLDAYCAADHLLVDADGRARGSADEALAALERERRVVLTVNQYFTASRIVARSNLLTVLPALVVAVAGPAPALVARPLPFALPGVQVAMLWHQRHDPSSAHRWLRARLLDAVADALGAPGR